MNYVKETKTFKSSNGMQNITYYIYKPASKPRAILQISHGMCEYLERYEPFIDFLCKENILVCGNDHLGHKNSAPHKEDLGYFAPADGWKFLVKDIQRLTLIIKKQYPDTPLFLFGHSMGSFIARTYLVQFGHYINGAIICGTSGTNPLLPAAKVLIQTVRLFKGERYRSPLIKKAMFGNYNSRYDKTVSESDWITRDQAIVHQYSKDEYCTFLFTASAFYDLTMLLGYVSSKKWYDRLPKQLPLYLISGDMDPVGNWGQGVWQVIKNIQEQKLDDFSFKLYKDFRHEVLNEIGREEAYNDILNWIHQRI